MDSARKNNKALPICKHKIVFLGEQSVGKTSIINRFIFNSFDPRDHPTVGIDFVSKNIILEDKIVRMQIWDTAGQERFRALIPNYIRDSSAVVIVFDVCEKSSFELVENWYEESKNVRGPDVVVYLVANKIDKEERIITTEEIKKKADLLNISFIEASAKDNTSIIEIFKNVGELLPLVVEPTSSRQEIPVDQEMVPKEEKKESDESNQKFTIKRDTTSIGFSKEKIMNCCKGY